MKPKRYTAFPDSGLTIIRRRRKMAKVIPTATDGSKLWRNLNVAFSYLRRYIDSKAPSAKFQLSEIDLSLVRNFKGGNSSVIEPLDSLSAKLKVYGESLCDLSELIHERPLRSFIELDGLVEHASKFLALTLDPPTNLAGFRASFASALLAAYFPDTLPVLDRQVLRGSEIEHHPNKQGQIPNIEKHYPQLIRRFHSELVDRPNMSLRDLDREWFTKGSRENRRVAQAPKRRA